MLEFKSYEIEQVLLFRHFSNPKYRAFYNLTVLTVKLRISK